MTQRSSTAHIATPLTGEGGGSGTGRIGCVFLAAQAVRKLINAQTHLPTRAVCNDAHMLSLLALINAYFVFPDALINVCALFRPRALIGARID